METLGSPPPFGAEAAAISSIVRSILSGEVASRTELERAKKDAARRFRLDRFLTNSEVYLALSPEQREGRKEIFRVHPRRSASGIVIVTVFTAPASCPHGTCVYCPGGPSMGTPQSYVPDGPSMRAARGAGFDPRLQAQKMLSKYLDRGHEASKVELMVEGGTFLAMPRDYQEWFIKGAFDGLNCAQPPSASLEQAHAANESAQFRSVGLTIETKPDWCRPEHVDTLLSYGATKVEIGVQALRDEMLRRSNRGHTVQDTLDAFRVARDSGLKVAAHMMPGLPGSTPDEDLADLLRLFEDESLRPDMMKLYPTTVVRGTALAKMCEAGLYEPYDLETVVELIAEMKAHVPPWHRIMRIQREIPEGDVTAGNKAGNLRELVLARVRQSGRSCGCIRCREVAMDSPSESGLVMRRQSYAASGGAELFCTFEYEETGKLAGFVRMRAPSERAHRPEMRGGSCVVRELKVYGRVVSVGSRDEQAFQHRGLGRALLEAAEEEARAGFDAGTLLVMSAVGTRNYYRKFGYERSGPYMAKRLAA